MLSRNNASSKIETYQAGFSIVFGWNGRCCVKTVIRRIFTLLALPLFLTSCATKPPVAFHKTDNSTLVIESLDNQTCQMLQPAPSARETNDRLLVQLRSLHEHQTAVVILENYNERRLGSQFRDRSMPWFLGLRMMGYTHIYFLQGQAVLNPEGLPTLAEYD
jgi:hypothetical protein